MCLNRPKKIAKKTFNANLRQHVCQEMEKLLCLETRQVYNDKTPIDRDKISLNITVHPPSRTYTAAQHVGRDEQQVVQLLN